MAAQDPTVSTESNGGALVATSVTFLVLSWLSVFLRTYVRAIMLKGFQMDDWLMLVAQAIFTISCSFILVGCYYGLGHHDKALDQFNEIKALEYQALATATYILNMMFIKLSIGIFLLRLATQKRYIYTIWGSVFIVAIWSTVLFFWNMFQCHPVAAQWDYTILQNDSTAFCVGADQIVSAAYALSIMTILSDWLYALIPIPMIWSVKMTKQAKITVIGVLGLGVFASVATLIRLKFLADLTDTADILFAGTDAMVWTLIEPGVAIVASSLVTIRPLLRAWKIRGFQSTENSKRTGAHSYGQHGSRTNRSNSGMPGFGSGDVTLVDIEAAHGKSATGNTSDYGTGTNRSKHSRVSQMSRISERPVEAERDEEPSKYLDGKPRPITIRSETYIIEGMRTPESPHIPGHTGPPAEWPLSNHSRSNSSLELATMEPVHSQTDGRVGLGSPR